MNIEDYISGSYKQQYQYKSFMPSLIEHDWEISDPSTNLLLSQANHKLGELNAYSSLIPDIDFFIAMHVQKEATASSKIEGTQTSIEEALQKIEYIDPEKRDDWEEVHNYIDAMSYAIEQLAELPLSSRLLKQTHKHLLQGVRGKHKHPGEFRQSQNWIGGASLNDATFIPPHNSNVAVLMTDLEKFINNVNTPIPDLIKIAIAHYQFETIHPFLDGNGRLGRLLITLYLVSKELLSMPTLYLSTFLEKNKALYYDNLTRVRTHNDLTQWIKFFLEGVKQTSENSLQTFHSITQLKTTCEDKIITLGKKAKTGQSLLTKLFSQPIMDSQEIKETLEIGKSTTARLIDDLLKLGILYETTGYKRNRIFIFKEYVDLFQ